MYISYTNAIFSTTVLSLFIICYRYDEHISVVSGNNMYNELCNALDDIIPDIRLNELHITNVTTIKLINSFDAILLSLFLIFTFLIKPPLIYA